MLVDNAGRGAVVLQSIRFQCFGAWIYTQLRLYTYVYVHMYVCICIYIYRRTHTHTHTHTHSVTTGAFYFLGLQERDCGVNGRVSVEQISPQ